MFVGEDSCCSRFFFRLTLLCKRPSQRLHAIDYATDYSQTFCHRPYTPDNALPLVRYCLLGVFD